MKKISYNYINPQNNTLQSSIQPWVEWRHISIGKTHCDACLKLDKCWFAKANMPRLPQHEYCHCTTVPKSILTVQKQATSVCAYEKFANYILDPLHPHNKGRAAMFETWGYTAADSNWLMNEYIRQAKQKYISGEYILGDLNSYGQRINILITLPRTDGSGVVTYKTGWIVEPSGKIRLVTPYGGKQ